MKKSTCIYVIQNGSWLMLRRDRKKNDINEGKYIGVGGKNEPGETFRECALREFREETGCELQDPVFAGFVDFCYDTLEEERIAVYTSFAMQGTPIPCREGTLEWVKESEVLQLPLWEGDRIFLKRMISGIGLPFHLKLVYDDHGTLIRVEELEVINE